MTRHYVTSSTMSEESTRLLAPSSYCGHAHWLMYSVTFLATLGGFVLGYDMGVMSGAMLYISTYFQLSTFWQEAIISSVLATGAIAALISGWLSDKIGRKLTIMVSSVFTVIGGVVMATANSKEILLAGRAVSGVGMGLAGVAVSVYVSEVSEAGSRGRHIFFQQVMSNAGILASGLLSGAFSFLHPDGWRYMLGMIVVPGVVQLCGFCLMPESPRWLVSRGRTDDARQVLTRLRAGADVNKELKDILKVVEEEKTTLAGGCQHYVHLLRSPSVRRALAVGCGLVLFQQWTGINSVFYYSGTVIKMAGFPTTHAVWLVTIPNSVFFIASFIGLYGVEKVGRRPILIVSISGTLVGLSLMAVGFQLTAVHSPQLNWTGWDSNSSVDCMVKHRSCQTCTEDNSCGFCYTDESYGTCLPSFNAQRSFNGPCNTSTGTEGFYKWAYQFCPSSYSWLPLLGMTAFVLAYAPGLGPVTWTLNAEIYPLWARSSCNAISSCVGWLCNIIFTLNFLTLAENITMYGTCWLFVALTVVGVTFVVLQVPETRNKSLEELEELFTDRLHKDSPAQMTSQTDTTKTAQHR
ncbi:proton myo-inositol cotransporter-like [Physella acuta]|uniref:proton myo-inositol cotransporter-like n=1 Tax=Physella acuta TaxID=109671 RepID=UPI0027DB5C14|nr:proton myo-inositol cotransporter-like [Physella acuta]XP_059150759.1 proton myo-inositol cotransporter-like [Physella acuta]XP_059150760.1 proton myo-inositol cotransporter-like [Physella acuta]